MASAPGQGPFDTIDASRVTVSSRCVIGRLTVVARNAVVP